MKSNWLAAVEIVKLDDIFVVVTFLLQVVFRRSSNGVVCVLLQRVLSCAFVVRVTGAICKAGENHWRR
jgi:hypothetical protein